MKTLAKKILAFAISFAMVATTVPLTAVSFAAEDAAEPAQAVEAEEFYEDAGIDDFVDVGDSEDEEWSDEGDADYVTIENVEIVLDEVVAYTGGYYDYYYDEDNDEEVSYYYYSPGSFRGTFTYTLTNGEEFTSSRCYLETEDYYFDLEYSTKQGSEEQWEAGGEYEVIYMYEDKEFPATVRIAESPVESMTIETRDVMTGTGGYISSDWNEDTEEEVDYYRYRASSFIDSWTMVMKDGEVIEGEDEYFYYNDREYELEFESDQSASNPWGIGAHEITVRIMGYETSFDVNVTESMIESIEATGADIVENTCGNYEWYYTDDDQEVKYYWYDPYYFASEYVITMKNGDVIKTDRSYYEYDGREYEIDLSYRQSGSDPWTAGPHEVTATTMGMSATFTVNIIECPIESMTFVTKEVPYMTGGDYDWGWIEETEEEVQYYRYYESAFIDSWTITMKDGEVIKGKSEEFTYNGKEYYIDFSSVQNASDPWDKGTHTMTASVMGYETEFDVVVGDSAVESIQVETVDVMEGCGGSYSWGWDEEAGEDIKYYEYSGSSFVSGFIITMKNGDVIEADGTWFDYNGNEYRIRLTDDQSAVNPWGVGTHQITANIMGESVTFDVNIVESPVADITVETKDIVEGTCGYLEYDWNEETDEDIEYYRYYAGEFIDTVTVTLKNGEEIIVNYAEEYDPEYGGVSLEYNGRWYDIEVSAPQDSSDPWGVGEHEITVSALGGEVTVPVAIVESPVADIEFKTSDIEAYTHGYFSEGWEDEEDYNTVWFKYDDLYDSYVVIMENGDTVESTKDTFTYKDTEYRIKLNTDQSSDNPWSTGEHSVTASVAGVETSFNVNIVESSIENIEIIGVEELEKDRWGDYGYPEMTLKVTTTDGDTFMEYLNAKNSWGESIRPDYVYIKWDNLEGPGGNNILFMNYAGIEMDIPVTILESSDFEYVEHEEGLFVTGYKGNSNSVAIPETINGKTVVGLAFDGYIDELTVPDTVKYISEFEADYALQVINLGAGVQNITADTFRCCYDLTAINVSEDNPYYTSIDGILYNKAVTEIIAFPPAKTGEIRIPATVTDMDLLNDYVTEDISVIFESGNGAFVTVDGVTYTADMTKVVYCDKDKAGAYTMPETVTKIASGAFRNCTELTDVTVSNKVTAITYEDFANCTSLANVSMPETVESIDAGAFRKCTNLTSLDIPAQTTSIDYMAFTYSGIKDAGTLDSVETIGARAFASTPLESINFTDALSVIDRQAFARTALKSVDLPDSLIEIAYQAFYKSALTEITIPDSVVILGEEAFMNNANLTSAVIGSGVEEIEASAFGGCSKLSTVDVRGTNVTVGRGAFANTAVSDINSENLGNIGSFAFVGTKIKDLNLTDGVTAIEYKAFESCTDLADIDMPESIESVAGHAFDKTTWYNGQESGVTYLGSVLYDTKGKLAFDTELLVKAGTTVLADVAFEHQTGLKSVTLPEGLTRIGVGTFFGCYNMTEINIPGTVTSVGKYAFRNCESLTTINVADGNGVVYSEDNVLYGDSGKELIYAARRADGTLTVPATVRTIRTGAIENSGIDTLIVKGKNTVIEDNEDIDFYYELDEFNEYEGVKIHCVEGSKADEFAKANSLKVVYIEEEPLCTTHSFGAWESRVAPTCTEDGVMVRECTVCGEEETKAAAATGHEVGEWVYDDNTHWTVCGGCLECFDEAAHSITSEVTIEPTCVAAGEETFTCKTCGYSYFKEIPATGIHTYGDWVAKGEASCETGGVKVKTCVDCGHEVEETLPATDHKAVKVPAVAATCDEAGLTEGAKCSECGKVLVEQKTVPALGHKPVTDAAMDATCHSTGLTEGSHCSVCDAVIVAQKETPALGHNPGAAATCTTAQKCTLCDEVIAPATGHAWKSVYTVDAAATINKAGSKSIHCKQCDAQKSVTKIARIKKTTANTVAFNGKIRNGNVTVVDFNGKKLVKGKDFTVTYKNKKGTKVVTPKNVGKYSVVVKFKGSYKGSVTKYFDITPKATVINKLTKPAKKQIKVTWQKRTVQVTGYQIRYSTKKNMSNARVIKVANFKTNVRTIKNLKAKQKYWVQVRTYKTVNGVNIFSAWSPAKTITTK